jgi:hypothetical protein
MLALAPGIAIVLTVLSLNIFGDGLRDALDRGAKVGVGALMLAFLVRRIIGAFLVCIAVTFIVFVIFIVVPGRRSAAEDRRARTRRPS